MLLSFVGKVLSSKKFLWLKEGEKVIVIFSDKEIPIPEGAEVSITIHDWVQMNTIPNADYTIMLTKKSNLRFTIKE